MFTIRKSGTSLMLAGLWLCAAGAQSAAQTDTVTDGATTFTSLFSFYDTNGRAPRAALVQATDGNLEGTTVQGGANCPPYGCGTIFEITPSGPRTRLRISGNYCLPRTKQPLRHPKRST